MVLALEAKLLMASFTLITQGMDVGYGEDGFLAWGTTDNFSWNDRGEYVHGEHLPSLTGEIVEWRIDNNPMSQWDQYAYFLPPEDKSSRENLLKAFWAEYRQPLARLERSRYVDDGGPPVVLRISLPRDPSLAVFIMSVAMAEKELHIHSGGWSFMDEDKLAPAVSHVGWTERFEPAFSSDMPILRLR
ncbi:MAG: hypothetical protein ACLGHU_09890 [Alphaproteobacteria bacterium]